MRDRRSGVSLSVIDAVPWRQDYGAYSLSQARGESRAVAALKPFGQEVRNRILSEYFASAGEVTAANAWEHVYRLLLWKNEAAQLAHIYDSNHMQKGKMFHGRAVRFTDALCQEWGVSKNELWAQIDVLFKGCVAELKLREAAKRRLTAGDEEEIPDPSELQTEMAEVLRKAGVPGDQSERLASQLEQEARYYFTISNKRKNALGEGFEDLLHYLLRRVSGVPGDVVRLRTSVSTLPGFKQAPPKAPGQRRIREAHPDLAFVVGDRTDTVVTAKWSMRQDRETQFAAEYAAYMTQKVQRSELTFALITNEFDPARLNNVAKAMERGAQGYTFHHIYHVNLDLLKAAYGPDLREVGGHIQTGKIRSLSDFLTDMAGQFGTC